MSETSFRVANFLKMFSMFLVLGSLIYFYAYVEDRLGFMSSLNDWYFAASKSMIFYTGLSVFAILNLISNIGINLYKGAKGYDSTSLLFRSANQKDGIHIALLYLLVGINFLLTCAMLYLAMIRINGLESNTDYIFLPVFGFIVLIAAMVNLLISIRKK